MPCPRLDDWGAGTRGAGPYRAAGQQSDPVR